MNPHTLNIASIFTSIDGEVNYSHQGMPTAFVRLAGCNLRCWYCDTKRAQEVGSGGDMSVEAVYYRVHDLGMPKVTVTGGEPLLQQPELNDLLEMLSRGGFVVSVETNGTLIPKSRFPHVTYVMDWKLSEEEHMCLEAFQQLNQNDWVKIIVGNRKEYIDAKERREYLIRNGCVASFAFSPMFGKLDPATLAAWLVEDRLEVVLNLQLHKLIWPTAGVDEER